jgi:hypothetical protein
MVDDVAEYREKLIETALEQDDEAMEAYLEGEMPSLETIKACIRKGTINLDFFPTYCGSAFKNKGIQLVLDAVIDYLPCPTEVKPQPEVDEEGEETGEFAIVDVNKPFRASTSMPWVRFRISTLISKCNSPIPRRIVSPESSSVSTRKDGSSATILPMAIPIFSEPALSFGDTAIEITGSGFVKELSILISSLLIVAQRLKIKVFN